MVSVSADLSNGGGIAAVSFSYTAYKEEVPVIKKNAISVEAAFF